MSAKSCLLAVCLVIVSHVVYAQPGDTKQSQADTLRRQLEQLEQKLKSLEETDNQKRGITQIGNTTLRSTDETRLVVRMYDLSELFTVAPAYEARQISDLSTSEKNLFPQVTAQGMAPGAMGGGFGGGGFGGAFSVPDRPRTVATDRPVHLAQVEARTSINTLVSAIQAVISPTNWDSVGGAMSITQLGNALIVSADANTHSQIEKLLDLFRQRWGTLKTVSVRAWWLPLTEEQLNEFLADGSGDEKPAFGVIDEAAFKKLLAAQSQTDAPIGYRATVTCYNGQTVGAVAGDQSVAITDIRPITTKPDPNVTMPVAYSPVVSVIHEGAALQVTPIVTTSGKYVVLDIHSRINRRLKNDSASPAAVRAGAAKAAHDSPMPGDVVAAIDRPRLAVQRLSTTLRVPIGSTMLIGGMTMSDEHTAKDQTLYLFVKLIVQELRDGDGGDSNAAKSRAPDEKPGSPGSAKDQ
jgi:hypothetical protein